MPSPSSPQTRSVMPALVLIFLVLAGVLWYLAWRDRRTQEDGALAMQTESTMTADLAADNGETTDQIVASPTPTISTDLDAEARIIDEALDSVTLDDFSEDLLTGLE